MSQETRHPARATRRSVLIADRAAGGLITGGGFMVIVAVLGIFTLLGIVVRPLFRDATVGKAVTVTLPRGGSGLLFCEVNQYRSLGMALYGDGVLTLFDPRDGRLIRKQDEIPPGRTIRAFARRSDGSRKAGDENLELCGRMALALDDGSVVLGRLEFRIGFPRPEDLAIAEKNLRVGERIVTPIGVAERTPIGQVRVSDVMSHWFPPLTVGTPQAPVALVDYRVGEKQIVFAALTCDGKLTVSLVEEKENLTTGVVRSATEDHVLPYEGGDDVPSHLVVDAAASRLLLVWDDGQCHRYDLRDLGKPVVVEKRDLCPEPGVRVTAARFLIGDQSLVVADSTGGCNAWSLLPIEGPDARTDGASRDAKELVIAHRLEPHARAASAIGVSFHDKCLVTASEDGQVWLRHLTTRRVQARMSVTGGAPRLVGFNARGDTILGIDPDGRLTQWPVDNPHPETTWSSLFAPTRYEGFRDAETVWQSSSGTDDFEPKLGLVPLVFGTLKATVYAMLFSVPIALLAAIYTSEFLSRKARALVKPSIEMMASLPSVVLGFLAALVLAPVVENFVVPLLLMPFLVPLLVVFGAHLWLFLPRRLATRLDGRIKLMAILAAVVAAIALAFPIGGWVENAFFAGDIRQWLARPGLGSSVGFWTGALLPFGVLGAVVIERTFLRRAVPAVGRSDFHTALAQLLRTTVLVAGGLGVSVAMGLLLQLLRADPRHGLVGTYVQRNTLIVGFVMGFAVIPIIYTIAEDALSSVPDHLRGAALGCGATRWQTASRIIVPTAMSGIFSAVMVGLGRATGETMIVVMAAGNTPIKDVNPFNGLASLSAKIAIELPEAVKDGTLYRVLFLAALTLFLMTFVANTIAEVVRMRFRKRAFEL